MSDLTLKNFRFLHKVMLTCLLTLAQSCAATDTKDAMITRKQAIEVGRKFSLKQGQIGFELSAEASFVQRGEDLLKKGRFRDESPDIENSKLYWEVIFTYDMGQKRRARSIVIIDAKSGRVVFPSTGIKADKTNK